jgi:serine/threonine-protein kinase
MNEIDVDAEPELLLTPVLSTPLPLVWLQAPCNAERLPHLERYRPVLRLAQGGMAEVLLAAWEAAPFTHRPVVLKRLHAQFREEPRLVQMFLDEARLVCQLKHPNIVKALEVGKLDGQCCLAMEYLEGQPLQRLVHRAYAQGGTLSIYHAVQIAVAVLDALHYAHEVRDKNGKALGIVHRDVSPQNIFICNDGSIKVLDFGIAKTTLQRARSSAGVVKGKLAYIAPEQANAQPVDRRADLWSVGVVLWEALTGQRLFAADSDAATLNLTLKAVVVPARARRLDVPVELDTLLMRALQREPELRYSTASMMSQQLQSWLDRQPTGEIQSLSATMRELFSADIAEQRTRVTASMAQVSSGHDVGEPSSVSGVVVPNSGMMSAEHLTLMTNHIEQLRRQNRLFARSLAASGVAVAVSVAVLGYWGATRGTGNEAAANGAALTVAPSSVSARDFVVKAGNSTSHGELNGVVSSGSATEPSVPAEVPKIQTPTIQNSVSHHTHAGLPVPRPALAPQVVPVLAPESRHPANSRRTAGKGDNGEIPDTAPKGSSDSAEAAAFGLLTIDTTPWAFVSVAGKEIGQTPLVRMKLPVGTQTLTLTNPELGIRTHYSVNIVSSKITVRRIGIE